MTAAEAYFRALVSGQRRGPAASLQRAGLWLASLPYGWAVRTRNRLYQAGCLRAEKAPVPVVSVGNLTLGGTGKTPCVEYVARFFRQHDVRVAILSRGYGAAAGRNDEALVLEENLPDVPHLQGADRAELARTAAVELESEVLVLDDGFQHRRLARELDVVLVDVTNPWGHGHLFPRGLLREPRSSLGRAGAIVLTRCDQTDPGRLAEVSHEVKRLAPGIPVVESTHHPDELVNEEGTAPVEQIRGRSVAAFCGIGNPDAFRQTLGEVGAEVVAFRPFPDHHAYTRDDVEALRSWAGAQPADAVVTTQKDMVKLRLARLGGRPLWAVRIRLQLRSGKEAFDRKLLKVLPTRPPA